MGQTQLQVQVFNQQSQAPLAGVLLTLPREGLQDTTQANGQATFQDLAPGHYHLHVEKEGFKARDLDVLYPQERKLTLSLQPTSIELQEVVVEESFARRGVAKSSLNAQNMQGELQNQISANSLGESLESLPGVSALNTGVGVSKPVIRGFMGNRVSVLDQGIKQEGQQWGQDHGLEIDPFQAQRMELVKGPQSLQYGSDATGGVLKILPNKLPPLGFSGQATTLYRSNNSTLGASGQVQYRQKEWFVRARLSGQRYRDFQVPAQEFTYNGFVLPITDNTLKNTAGQLLSYRVELGQQKKGYSSRYLFSQYRQQLGLYPGATGIPRAFDVGTIGSTANIALPNQAVHHTKLYTRQNFRLGGHWLQVNAGYQFNNRAENSLPHNHGFEELDSSQTLALGLQLHTLTLNADYSWHRGKTEFTAGLNQQYKNNQRAGFEFLIPSFSTYNGGVFLLAENVKEQRWNWNTGLRLDFGSVNSNATTTRWWSNFDSLVQRSPALNRRFFNYSAAAGLSFLPNNRWNVKANLAKSFRLPVVAELASNGVHHGTFRHEQGQANLKPEEGLQLDLSAQYQRPRFLLSLSPFANYFFNYIFLQPSGRFSNLPDAGQLYRYNQSAVFQTGAELYLDWHFWQKLHWSNGAEYLFNQNLATNLPLPFTPPFSNLMQVNWEEERWHAGASWRFTAAQNRTDRNEDATPDYHLFHLKAGINFKVGAQDFTLETSCTNLFNTAYLKHLSRYRILNLPEQGRNFNIALKARF